MSSIYPICGSPATLEGVLKSAGETGEQNYCAL